jgi:hypothetical protein
MVGLIPATFYRPEAPLSKERPAVAAPSHKLKKAETVEEPAAKPQKKRPRPEAAAEQGGSGAGSAAAGCVHAGAEAVYRSGGNDRGAA